MGLKVVGEWKATSKKPGLYYTILYISYDYSMAAVLKQLTLQDLLCAGTLLRRLRKLPYLVLIAVYELDALIPLPADEGSERRDWQLVQDTAINKRSTELEHRTSVSAVQMPSPSPSGSAAARG